MNTFDVAISTCCNQFSRRSVAVDELLVLLSGNHLLKGGVLSALLWWVWFRCDEPSSRNREHVLATLVGSVVAMALARGLVLILPFRPRPLHEPGLRLLLPYGMSPSVLADWSSFPSDHAVLFFGLSAGLFFISRRVGICALSYTAFFIAFPRIYLGLHYPTDIIGGAVIGIALVVASNVYLLRRDRLYGAVTWSRTKPHLFYPLFFLVTYQIADMFGSSRAIVSGLIQVCRLIFGY